MLQWPDWPYSHYTMIELLEIINARDYRCFTPQRLCDLINERKEKLEEQRELGRQAWDAIQFRREFPDKGYIDKLVRITRRTELYDRKTSSGSPWSDGSACYALPPPPYCE